jgi:FkbM family methyltransferase
MNSSTTMQGESGIVSITTLDHYFEQTINQRPIDFIIMDVEGAVFAVLRDVRNLLTSNLEIALMLECQAHHCA